MWRVPCSSGGMRIVKISSLIAGLLLPALASAVSPGIDSGLAAAKNGEYARAISEFQSVVKSGPPTEVENAWVGIGGVELLKGDYSKALAAYDHALELNPQNSHALNG